MRPVSITGNVSDTHNSDNQYQVITEGGRLTNGRTAITIDDYRWSFTNLKNANQLIFEGYVTRLNTSEVINVQFSTTGRTWTTAFSLSNTTENTFTYNFATPINGNMLVRVIDSRTGTGDPTFDSIYVDRLVFVDTNSNATTPINTNLQVIDPNGNVKLLRDTTNNLVFVQLNGFTTPLQNNGAQVNEAQFIANGWQILAAETINTNQNKILWKELSTGRLHTWAVDSNWSYIASEAIVSPTSTQGLVLQQQFNVDSSGNPIIAQAPATTIDPITGLAHIELAPVDMVEEVWYSNPVQAIGAADTVEHIMSVDSYIPLLETNTLTSVIMNNDVFSNTINI